MDFITHQMRAQKRSSFNFESKNLSSRILVFFFDCRLIAYNRLILINAVRMGQTASLKCHPYLYINTFGLDDEITNHRNRNDFDACRLPSLSLSLPHTPLDPFVH